MSDPHTAASSLASLESVLSTRDLSARPPRPPDYEAENRALLAISQHMADSPGTMLQKLADVALELCQAGSAGVSLLSKENGGFYWPAIAGAWKSYIGKGPEQTPSPSSVVVERGAPQLFTHPERCYPHLAPAAPPVVEELMTPFYVQGQAVGTLWLIAHDEARKFDSEDTRLLECLGRLAAAAYPLSAALEDQKQHSESLREINQALLVSSVRQHELVEQAREAEAAMRASEEQLALELKATRRLQDASTQLIREEDDKVLYDQILDAAMAILRSGMASIQVLDEGEDALRMLAFRGFDADFGQIFGLVRRDSLTSFNAARQEGRRVIVQDVETCAFMAGTPVVEQHRQVGIRASQSTPLVARGGSLLGVISTHWRDPHQPVERDLRLLDVLARQAADALERSHSEKALRESEQRIRTLVSIITDVPWTADREGQFTELQLAWAAYTGQSWDELRGFGWANALHPEDRQHILELWHEACQEHTLFRCGGRIWHATSSQYRYFQARATALLNQDGSVREWVGACTDVEEQKRAEEALRQSAERLSFMAESMPQKIFTAKPNGDFDYVNRQWMEFSGLDFAEIRDWGWTQIVDPDDIAETSRLWKHSIETAEPFQCMNRLRRADGSYRWHLSRAHAMRDAGGNVTMWIGSSTDIQYQREREEQLRETQKLESLGVLAAGIAHDFNNLLTGILGNASMLAENAAEADQPLLGDIVACSKTAASLVKQLMAYAGKGHFQITRFNLSALVRDMMLAIRALIPTSVRLDLALDPEVPLLEADASQIQQLVMGLVMNASEAIGTEPGVIWVSTGIVAGHSIHITVRDSGSGMDEATRAKIFDPFFTTKFLGRGLGLAAVSGIVRRLEGQITVDSTPGKGSTFTIVLPAVGGYSPKITATPLDSDPGIAKGLILVVDDDPIVLRFAKMALEHGGYTVLLAENGLEAVSIFHQHSAAITGVFLDMGMPLMGGDEVLRRLRKIRANVSVLIASGYSELIARERFGAVDANFIQKPFNVRQLLEAIRAISNAARKS